VATRFSGGGEADGVWRREIVNGKLYWVGVNLGTESNWWGEDLALPVNAVGDIIIEAQIRYRHNTGLEGLLGIGFNHAGFINGPVRYGMNLGYEGQNEYFGSALAGGRTIWPGTPEKDIMTPPTGDNTLTVRVLRRNGYVFYYANNFYVGHFAYAATITEVNIINHLRNTPGDETEQRWVDWIKVYPRSVVEP
jgi:hypothetical protein